MPIYTPFPCSGVIYDLDASTELTSGDVLIENFTKSSRITSSINSVGEYTQDLANCKDSTGTLTGWDVGDVICLTCAKPFRSGEIYYKIAAGDTVLGADIYLKNSESVKVSCRLYAVSFSSDAARSLHLLDRANNIVKTRVNVVADTTATIPFGNEGIYFEGGIRQIITATTVDMTAPGSGTQRGDTATNVGNSVTLMKREVP